MDNTRPAYDIDDLLAAPDPETAVRALVQAVEGARKGKRLIGHERVIYHPYQFHWRIFWDGIDLTLLNLGVARLYWAWDGLEKIGARERATILKQVLDSFGTEEEVRELVKKPGRTGPTVQQSNLFRMLDRDYRNAGEDFYGLVVAYVRRHLEEFRGYGRC